MTDPYKQYLDKIGHNRAVQAADRLKDLSHIDPDVMKYAERVHRERLPNVPPVELAQDPEALKQYEQDQKTIEILKKNPSMIQWLEVPENAAFSHDELERLNRFNELPMLNRGDGEAEESDVVNALVGRWKGAQRAYQGGFAFQDASRAEAMEHTLHIVKKIKEDPEAYATADIKQLISEQGGGDEAYLYMYIEGNDEQRSAIEADIPNQVKLSQEGLAEAVRLIAEYERQMPPGRSLSDVDDFSDFVDFMQYNTIASSPELLAAAAITMITGGTGGVILSSAVVGGTTGGLSFGETMADIASEGGDLTDKTLLGRASIAAMGSGVSETLLGLVSRFTGLRGKHVADMFEGAVRDVLKKTGKEFGENAIEEAAVETFQTMMQDYAKTGTIDLSEEGLKRYAEAAASGAIVGSALGGGFGAVTATAQRRELSKINKARLNSAQLEEVHDLVKETKLAGRSEKVFRKFLQSNNADRRSVYIDAEQLIEIERVAPGTIESLNMLPETVQEAAQQGTDVAINLENYLLSVPKATPDAQKMFIDHGRINRSDYSAAQADEVEADINESEPPISAMDEDTKISLKSQIVNEITQKLKAAGQDYYAARASAELHGAFFESMADKYGESVLEMYKLDVMGPGNEAGLAGGRVLNQNELPPLTPRPGMEPIVEALQRGATPEELLQLPEVRAKIDEMMSIPPTAAKASEPGYMENREFVLNRDTGETVTGVNAMYSEMDQRSAEFAGEGGVKQDFRVDIVLGPPAAGKSSIAEKIIAPEMGGRVIDGDMFKSMIPEFGDGIGANAVHAESSTLANDYLDRILATGDNIVLPKIGDRVQQIEELMQKFREAGYKVNLVVMDVEADQPTIRNMARFAVTGRLVPPEYVMGVGNKPTLVYEQLKGNADGYAKYDNNVPFGQPALVLEDTTGEGLDAGSDGAGSDNISGADGDVAGGQAEAPRQDGTAGDRQPTGGGELDGPGYALGNEAPLEGAPQVEGASGPDPRLVAVAEQYARDQGIDLRRQAEFATVDEGFASRVADAYEAMEHAPQDPLVQEAYRQLIEQTMAQYQALVDAGYEFTFFTAESDPYGGNPWNAMRDLRANQKMAVFGTYDGYGTEGITDSDLTDNPMLQDTGLQWADQEGVMRPVTANDLFRAVHDAFGHGLEGAGFRARGEENAWQAHIRLFTGGAVAAITSETRGQNSWLNYGPYGETNRTAGVEDTVFAEQKTGLMPEWTWTENRVGDMEPEVRQLQQGARGRIVFPEGGIASDTTLIELSKISDLSTFLHESGHYFLEMFQHLAMQDGSPQIMKDDLAKINEWMGRAADDTSKFTTEQHELWADTFEQYLMEGKAPTPTLKSAFAKFSRWLSYVYKNIQRIGKAKLTPEIKEVMENMLATEEALDNARVEFSDAPVYTDAFHPTMTEDEYEAYKKAADRADGEAHGRALKRAMAKVRARRTKEYKQKMKEAREEIRAELLNRPEHALVENLGGADGPKINRASIVREFGAEALDNFTSKARGTSRNLYSPDGEDVGIVAELSGMTPRELLDTVKSTEKLADAVERLADEQVTAEMEASEASLEAEAMASIKNPAAQERNVRELKSLQQQRGGGSQRWHIINNQIKEEAEAAVDKMEVKDVMNSDGFLRASKRHAREAEKLINSLVKQISNPTGKANEVLDAAIEAKRKQIFNDHAFRYAREQARLIEKNRLTYMRLDKKSQQKAIGPEYMDAIDAILAKFDLRKVYDKDAVAQTNLTAFYQVLMEGHSAGRVNFDPAFIDGMMKRHYSTLTLSEMNEVMDAVNNLIHMGKASVRMIIDGKKVEFGLLMEDVSENLSNNLKKRRAARSKTQRKSSKLQTIRHSLQNTDGLLDELDHGQTGVSAIGTLQRVVKKPLDEAMDRFDVRFDKIAEDLKNLYKGLGTRRELEKMQTDVKTYDTLNGDTLSKMDLVMLLLNLGNEGNASRVSAEYDLKALETVLLSELTEKEFRFVQDAWDYLDSFWPEVEANTRKMDGIRPKKVKHKLMINGLPSFMSGGYFPIRYDKDVSAMGADIDRASMALEGRAGVFAKAMTERGHAQQRKDKVNNAVLELDPTIMENHVISVVRDIEFAEAIANAGRVVYSNEFRQELAQYSRQDDANFLQRWLEDVAIGEHKMLTHTGSKLVRMLRSGVSMQALGFNFAAALIQTTGLVNAIPEVKGSAFTGVLKALPGMGGADFINRTSSFMRERHRTFNKDVADLRDMTLSISPTRTGTLDKLEGRAVPVRRVVTAVAMAALQQAQYHFADKPTWLAAYDRGRRTMSDEDAAFYADSIVRKTQGSGRLTDLTAIERGRIGNDQAANAWITIFTTLYSYMGAMLNRVYLTGRGAQKGWRQGDHQLLMAQTMSAMWLLTMDEMLYKMIREGVPDDEDEETWSGFVADMALSKLGMFPGLREVDNVMRFGGSGGGAAGTFVDKVANTIWGGKDVYEAMSEGAEIDYEDLTITSFEMLAIITKMPVSKLFKVYKTAADDSLSTEERNEKLGNMISGGATQLLLDE